MSAIDMGLEVIIRGLHKIPDLELTGILDTARDTDQHLVCGLL
jgi:hypothetical protein